ncbi:MAG: hypothetical protein H8K10_01935 [Nitrospira sp.]|nr:hypothetical protein [Nitrospira sp.]
MSHGCERETVDQTLAFQLGRRSALQDIERALRVRAAGASGHVKSECRDIIAFVVQPLLQDAEQEAELLSHEGDTSA